MSNLVWSLDILARKSQRDSVPKPRVARNELPWETVGPDYNPKGGCVSIPNISFLPFDLVFAQQRSQFVLKSHLPVIFLMAGNVFFDLFQIRLTDREVRITSLPFETGVIHTKYAWSVARSFWSRRKGQRSLVEKIR